MTANVQGSNILDVLKKKMRATKEECEKFKEDAEDLQRKLQVEISRREEVSFKKIVKSSAKKKQLSWVATPKIINHNPVFAMQFSPLSNPLLWFACVNMWFNKF